jgi:hypothetical protein
MQNNKNNQKPATLFFLALFDGKMPELYTGVKTREGRFGPAIVLPEIPGMRHGKNIVSLDKFNPADVSANGKVFNAFFKLNGGTKKFADPQTFITLTKPTSENNDDTKIFIVCSRRFEFANTLSADICVKTEKGTGNANGSIAPGLLVLNDGDSVKITWEGKKYTISNFEGFVHMTIEKPTPVKKEVKVKAVAPEMKVDNRQKIEGPKVVGKIDLKPKKVEKPVQVPVAAEVKKPAVKPTAKKPENEKKKFFKKGPSDNGNHFVPATVAVPDYVPATTGLGSVTGAEKLAAMVAEMEKGSGKKGTRKSKATVA